MGMSKGRPTKQRIRILVKAYPQPSRKYEETVCCAGVTEDGQDLLRLYPIRYRRLNEVDQFDRFDLVEMFVWEPADDFRPESRKVVEDSIHIVARGKQLKPKDKVKIWRDFIAPSLRELREENRLTKRSLGIIKPDPGSVEFVVKKSKDVSSEDKKIADALFAQQALFEKPLNELQRPGYAFCYKFTSDGTPHFMQIHDWEVQAAYINFKKRYGEDALAFLKNEYQNNIPKQNLHFIMGTMLAHPTSFIIIGLLRSKISPEELGMQKDFFE